LPKRISFLFIAMDLRYIRPLHLNDIRVSDLHAFHSLAGTDMPHKPTVVEQKIDLADAGCYPRTSSVFVLPEVAHAYCSYVVKQRHMKTVTMRAVFLLAAQG
jgi:hypothetical protein